MDELCYWCLKEINFSDDWVTIEGFTFCNEKCEDAYYVDRGERKKSGKPPLGLERQNEAPQE